MRSINKELILAELKRSRDALNSAIAYLEVADTYTPQAPVRSKTIRIGEGRAVAILACLRDSGGKMLQREFEEACLRNSRTLVGAGGFIARGSIVRQVTDNGDVEYELTEKGMETVARWETRYGSGWVGSLETPEILGNTAIHDQQKVRLVAHV